MIHDSKERMIALAGVYQAVHCVLTLARRGTADSAALESCIYSLLQIDAAHVEAVFGNPGALVDGAQQIVAQFSGKNRTSRNLEITRYVILLMRLEQTLAQREDLLTYLHRGILEAQTLYENYVLQDQILLNHFADLYRKTIGNLKPRIILKGDLNYLRHADHQARIRALLLAGIRAALLWRQIGGTRWKMLFDLKRIIADAKEYINFYV